MDSPSATVALSTSVVISILAMVLVIYTVDTPINTFYIPVIAYAITVVMSMIYQYAICSTVSPVGVAISNLSVLISVGAAVSVLFVETLPILRWIFGESQNANPATGLPYEEKDYKIQFFSNIVKAVIPSYVQDSTKQGFVYSYWVFWMTLLPYYFTVSIQGFCK